MVQFECSFECATRDEATYALLEMINQINGGYHWGDLNYADGSWSCLGEDEDEDEDEDEE
jgi:hypothetical protein